MTHPANPTTAEYGAFIDAHKIGEPVTRSDGKAIRLFESPYGGVVLYVGDSLQMGYLDEELIILGDGDRNRGIVNVGKAAYIGARNEDEESFDYEPRYLDGQLYAARDEEVL